MKTFNNLDNLVNGVSRDLWDFSETEIQWNPKHKVYLHNKRIAGTTISQRAERLKLAQLVVDTVISGAKTRNLCKISQKEREQIALLIKHHDVGKSRLVKEINTNDKRFYGMNKPYDLYIDKTPVPIGPIVTINGVDANTIRPVKRTIFLDVIRNDTVGDIKNLVIHELAHTVANHCIYRPDDHGSDFIAAENLVAKYYNYKNKS